MLSQLGVLAEGGHQLLSLLSLSHSAGLSHGELQIS